MAFSVVFRYGSVVREDHTRFWLVRARCGHEHLTVRSAAECRDKLVKGRRGIGYIVGRFGNVEDRTTQEQLTHAEIDRARKLDLDIAESFRIVLGLAKESVRVDKRMNVERTKHAAACDIVEQFVVRLR
jgi:hypothetical protein